jgi:hypothetical protein
MPDYTACIVDGEDGPKVYDPLRFLPTSTVRFKGNHSGPVLLATTSAAAAIDLQQPDAGTKVQLDLHSVSSVPPVQHNTAPLSTAQPSAPPHSTALHRSALHSTAPLNTAQHSAAHHRTAQYHSAPLNPAQQSAAHHSTAQYRTAQLPTPVQHSAPLHTTDRKSVV